MKMTTIKVYPSELEQFSEEVDNSSIGNLSNVFFKFRESKGIVDFSLERAKNFLINSQTTIGAGAEYVLLDVPAWEE